MLKLVRDPEPPNGAPPLSQARQRLATTLIEARKATPRIISQ